MYFRDWNSPWNGSSTASMRATHLTLAIPYQAGTTRRTGPPNRAGTGRPFIS